MRDLLKFCGRTGCRLACLGGTSVFLLAATLHAAELEDLTWTTSGGEISISDCDQAASGHLEIPPTIEGNPVTSIGHNAFEGCRGLTSVTIPNGVTYTGSYAFRDCSGLTSITIPASVTTIGGHPSQVLPPFFKGCTNLTNIEVDAANPNFRSQDGVLFNRSLNELIRYPAARTAPHYDIPESVIRIEEYAFSDCRNLNTVTLPTLTPYAFAECTSITSITIPDGFTWIPSGAFANCRNLANITISASVNTIERYVFWGCRSLTSIDLDAENPNFQIQDGVLFNESLTSLLHYPAGKIAPHYDIPETVTGIEEAAFAYCSNLTSVRIHAGVASIGAEAFSSSSSLTSIEVDGDNPNFQSRDGVFFSKDLTALIQYPGGKRDPLYDVPESVTSIESGAFSESNSLVTITLPDGLLSIKWGAFYFCSSLSSITIPDSVKFSTLTDGYAFWGCSSLTSVTLPVGLDMIPHGTFRECSSLASITIPDSVTDIFHETFEDCRSLTSITIPHSVMGIHPRTFYNCSRLAYVFFEGNAPWVHSRANAFDGVASGAKAIVQPGSHGFGLPGTTWNGLIVEEHLLIWAITIGDVTITDCDSSASGTIDIPSTIDGKPVTSIGDHAFESTRSITSITIPDSVTSIGNSAFQDCSSLATILFDGIAPLVGLSAFDNVAPGADCLVWPEEAASFGGAGATWNGLTVVLREITQDTLTITDVGFVDEDTFFIEFSPGGPGFKVTRASDLDFSNATDVPVSLEPATAGDRRFEFDVSETRDFFRIEPQ